MFANSRGVQVMQSYAPFMLCYPLFMQNDVNYILIVDQTCELKLQNFALPIPNYFYENLLIF